jgi:hypothetical protein
MYLIINQIKMETKILDGKDRILNIGDLVVLAYEEGLCNKEVKHDKGDVFQYIGGDVANIGCFIKCETKQRSDFFADRTLKIVNKPKN